MKYEVKLVVVEAPDALDDFEAIANIIYEGGRDDAFLFTKKGKTYICLEQEDSKSYGLDAILGALDSVQKLGVVADFVSISDVYGNEVDVSKVWIV